MRRTYRRILIILPVSASLLISGCLPKAEEDDWFNSAAGDDTPIEERQYVDDYATYVIPAILEFLEELSQAGAGEWNRGEKPPWFSMHSCLLTNYDWEPDGYEISLNSEVGDPIPPETAAEVGNKIFPQLGFTTASTKQADNRVYVSWIDWYNGGNISVNLDQNRTIVSARSECRYARDDDATWNHIQELAPRPSEPSDSPTPPGTPSPTPGQTRTRPRTTHRP